MAKEPYELLKEINVAEAALSIHRPSFVAALTKPKEYVKQVEEQREERRKLGLLLAEFGALTDMQREEAATKWNKMLLGIKT
jgi:hypothetical protein